MGAYGEESTVDNGGVIREFIICGNGVDFSVKVEVLLEIAT